MRISYWSSAVCSSDLATEGWVGDDDIDLAPPFVILQRCGECVVVQDVGWRLDAVQHHVGDTEEMRQRFLFNADDTVLHGLSIFDGLHVPDRKSTRLNSSQ